MDPGGDGHSAPEGARPKVERVAPPGARPKRAIPDAVAERLEQLKLVALGCNEECTDRLRRLFLEAGIHSWSLNEYVLTHPIRKEDGRNGDSTPSLFAPFVERRLEA